jgi:hypothetical protein
MTTLLKRDSSKIRVVLVLLLASLTLLLTACPGEPTLVRPEIILSVNDADLPDGGGPVTLTAEVTKGEVDSVTFARDKGAAIPAVTTPDARGDFVTTVTVTETTTFTATATGPGGTGSSNSEQVTVAPPNPANDPKAPNATAALKGFEDLALVVGAPTGLAVVATTIPGVTGGIVGDVKAETKPTSKGNVEIKAGTNVLEFVYTPNAGATGTDFFEYTVAKSNREAEGRIDISLADISSADIQLADSLADINDTSSQRILLVSDITCNSNNNSSRSCISLEANQELIGLGSITVDGMTITNANTTKPKIIANIPNTRQPGVPACSFNPPEPCEETTVVNLADNVIIEGIELAGTGEGYFVGFKGESDSNSVDTLSGNITIKNVTMNGSSGKPIYIKYGQGTNYGNYNLLIESLDLNDANDTLVIGNPKKLTFKSSTIELVEPFGDNVGINIDESVGSDIEIDDVDVDMESTVYKLDVTPGNNAAPFIIDSRKSGVTTELTVKNTDIVIGEIAASDVFSFKVRANGTSAINITDSSANTAPRDVQYSPSGITGEIDITLN